MGGTEEILDMVQKDELLKLLPNTCIKENAMERFQNVVKHNPVVLFMKGSPEKPYDGYQQRAVTVLGELKVKFYGHDIMPDSELRDTLKDHARWNSFPMLFVKGAFVGGLTFLEETLKSGKISSFVPTSEIALPLREKIVILVNKGPYMLFMKGSPMYPACD